MSASPHRITSSNDLPVRLGRFIIREELGRGSLGIVYLAHDPVIDRLVAIKTLRPRLGHTERQLYEEQFINEARAAGQLSHANIVVIHDIGSEGSTPFMAMEYLHGREISKMLEDGERFTPDDVASIGWKIADALDHAHQHGVVHRDVKPANIFLVDDHQPKIMDFGIARIPNRLSETPAKGEATPTLFHDNLLGTPHYMSPEQANGQAVDPRTDIYSLGAVMFEMLTGHKPFEASDTEKLLQQITSRRMLAPHKLASDVPLALSRIVSKAMHRDPEKRYQRAAEMALDIKRHLTLARREQRRLPTDEETSAIVETRRPALLWPLIGLACAAAMIVYARWPMLGR
ncbi:serine/threonine-protein kinase [uncultured Oxalicibacterium sp.]|uniref:serine/threonine-protein kinase n=1 Tax=uncultured Oxalicibacterium sp. TaxID=1168540 RepID=UPI0025F639C8|nr:serine/threonine-protein kinase [uncultured Oxalicibacterium sp.]